MKQKNKGTLAGSIMLIEPKHFGSGYKPEPAKREFKIVYDLASDCRKQIKGFRKYLKNYKKDWMIM